MNRVILTCFVVFLSAGLSQAAEFTAGPRLEYPEVAPTKDVRLPNITQSTDPTTITGGTVACVSGSPTVSEQNQWLRRFFLNTDHSIVQQYDVTSIDWAIGNVDLEDPGATDPLGTVNIYALANGTAFTYANMGAPLGTASLPITQADVMSFVNFPVIGSIVTPATTDLVVEFVMADGTGTVVATDLWNARLGYNGAGELRDSYIASAACSMMEPVTYASIGFGAEMLVLTVNGNEVPVELMTFTIE